MFIQVLVCIFELVITSSAEMGFLVPVAGSLEQASVSYISAIGDPGMKSPNARFGLEAWNFCNEVGEQAPNMGSPRLADCADLHCTSQTVPGSLILQPLSFPL